MDKPETTATLPTGTVTFLFSDIEGSTQRWEAHPNDMDAAVELHDAVMRKVIAQHHGLVFKTVGDAFCAAFARIDDAVAAAIDAQRSLASEDFSKIDGLLVRMAVHVGEASERDGDYFGPTVNRVARLMAIGHGGQVLLSAAVHEVMRTGTPANITFADLGLRRLKDLTKPEHVWQLSADGLSATFPPLNSLDARANNLPIQATGLVGRERDLDDVKTLVGKHRFVTLSGSGGVGKTRVALQVGADSLDRFPDGVWFIDLAPIRDPELVSSVLAKVLGIRFPEGHIVDEAIPQWLKHKQLLLILDNCEQVLAKVAELTDAILRTAPDVRLFATSRQALGIAGEIVYRLPSLAVPAASTPIRADQARSFGALSLFIERARAADSRFALTDGNATTIADICRHLDGIPLAIELAAARVKVLSVRNLAQRLNDRFKILTGGSRTAQPRQKTLTALIDWSYDLLTRKEKIFFSRAGIFVGGFSFDAAAALCAGKGIAAEAVLDLLSSLIDKSLIVVDTADDRERYRLLESTRAYALEKLVAAGDIERLTRRHAEYFRDQAHAADLRFGSESLAEWLPNFELEIDNYRATLQWAIGNGRDAALGGAVAGALQVLWVLGGLTVEGRYWVARSQAAIEESAHPQLAARLWRAHASLFDGNRRRDSAQRALALYQLLGDVLGTALSRLSITFALIQMGQLDEANEAIAGVYDVLRSSGKNLAAADCLAIHGKIQSDRGDIAAARELYDKAHEAYKLLGDENGKAIILSDLAELEFADYRVEQALRLMCEALKIHKRGKNAKNLAITCNNCAVYRLALGDMEGARRDAREGLRWATQAQFAPGIATGLQHIALLGALSGNPHDSAQILGNVNSQHENLGMQREPTEKWGYGRLMDALRERFSDSEIERLAAEGAAWSENQTIERAMTL